MGPWPDTVGLFYGSDGFSPFLDLDTQTKHIANTFHIVVVF